MGEYWRDPELNRLIHELNERVEPEGSERLLSRLVTPPEESEVPAELERLLRTQVSRGASDLHLMGGLPPMMRVNGRIAATDGERLEQDQIRSLFLPLLNGPRAEQLRDSGSVDFSIAIGAGKDIQRFRANLHRYRGGLAAAIRALPTEIPTLRQLELPESLTELVMPSRGLVLVCGATGSGKTTTLASLIDHINRTQAKHIITIEDPVEYVHANRTSVVKQIEIGRDAASFAGALRAALRQDPDVILVGEMRDPETVSTALTAAETGHLILATLHTNDAAQSVHRIIDMFPPGQHSQVYRQLALSLHAILVQQLIPRSDGRGRVAALELLRTTPAVRNHIRKEQLHNLYNEITLGTRQGMVTLESSLARLVREQKISMEEARVRASHPEELDNLVR